MKTWQSTLAGLALTLMVASDLWAQGQAGVAVTVLYDNYSLQQGLKADWGFACLVTGTEKTVLFDTGTKGDILLDNMKKLNVSPKTAELAVISHAHGDHMGGLLSVLEENRKLSVYLPASCPKERVQEVAGRAASVVVVEKPTQICKNVYVVGPVGQQIIEQALVIDTDRGLIMLMGCSHPGVVEMVKKAKEHFRRDIAMVCGGMHLLKHSEADVRQIAAQLKEAGVQKICPTHCTGDKAIAVFKGAFGDSFVAGGVGKMVKP